MIESKKPRQVISQHPFPRKHCWLEKGFDFLNLNRFFLREGKRAYFEANEDAIVSPVEGKLVEIQTLRSSEAIHGKKEFARHEYYTFQDLVHGHEQQEAFEQGLCFNLYLSPMNLHYVLFPTAVKITKLDYHPAFCWPILFMKSGEVKNERLVIYGETQHNCPMIIVLIGSFLVSGVECIAKAGQEYERASVLGGFKLGSTVMMLFPKGRVESIKQTGAKVCLEEPIAHFL